MEDQRWFHKFIDYTWAAVISYFLTILFDYLFFQKIREEIKGSSLIYIDRPGSLLDQYLHYAFVIPIVLVLLFALHRFVANGSPYLRYLFIAVLACIVSVTVLHVADDFFVPQVEARTYVSGRLNSLKLSSYLFVRAVTDNQCWLQEPIPLFIGHDCRWNASASFGGLNGQKFELIVITDRSRLDPHIFSRPGGYDCSLIPTEAERYIRLVKLK